MPYFVSQKIIHIKLTYTISEENLESLPEDGNIYLETKVYDVDEKTGDSNGARSLTVKLLHRKVAGRNGRGTGCLFSDLSEE